MSGSEYESSNEEDEMYIAGGVGGSCTNLNILLKSLLHWKSVALKKSCIMNVWAIQIGVFVHTALNNPIQHHAFVVMKPQQSKEFWNVWLRSMELRFNALLIILDLNQYALMFLFLKPLTKDLGQNQCSSK
uniref:uncharacterized protein LOC120330523 isoform X1 n=1 Tax=Styela clava TaxID=7725 RepID=UPI00193A8E2A|nr:uncharacterized protein LOC120330523 isoform X1 [Styela clava]